MKKIAIWGDSVAQGFYDAEKEGWVARLIESLKNKNKNKNPKSIFNLSISGDDTNDLLYRFEVESTARKPELIIFAIGINDSQYYGTKDKSRISKEDSKNNLYTLIKQARKFTDKIVFVGLTRVEDEKVMPVPWKEGVFYDNENIKEYDSIIKEVCNEEKLFYIDMFNILELSDLEDGLHPNSQGHQKMAESIENYLVKNELI